MSSYRGRFAPSPTGPLHFGSLFAALISFLEAKKNDGLWLVRIEDIDPLREMPGATESILQTLQAHHLFWDEQVSYQSEHSVRYEQTLSKLESTKALFRCPCSRKQLSENNGRHSDQCRRQDATLSNYALKFRKNNLPYAWIDQYQGRQSFNLRDDFVLKRKEGFYAYQLAVVSDDHAQGITHVVRGYDLLDSTPMQLAIYQALDLCPPTFAHFPVLCAKGQKLSKQNYAEAINDSSARDNLIAALRLLGLNDASKEQDISQMLSTAIKTWDPGTIHGIKEILSPL